jgi:hypothetical protein
MSISNFYTQTLILMSSSTSSTAGYMGETTGAEFTTAASVKASVNIVSENEAFEFDKLGIDAQYKCNSAVSTEILFGRRCRWNGDTYVIVSEPNDVLQKHHHISFLLGGINA